jgi:hypothetical protein
MLVEHHKKKELSERFRLAMAISFVEARGFLSELL